MGTTKGRGATTLGWRRRAWGAGTALALLGVGLGMVALLGVADRSMTPPSAHAQTPGASLPDQAILAPESPSPPDASPPHPVPEQPSGAAPDVDQSAGAREPSAPELLPENVNASPALLVLQDALAQEIAAYREQVSEIEVAVAVTDLQTGETISIGGNRPQRTGCTIMMFGLLAAVDEFQAGRADPSQVAASIKVGIGSSSPPHVYWFLQALFGKQEQGVEQARQMMRSWGMRQSQFDHVPYYGDGTRENFLTALELNLVLGKLYRRALFNEQWTAYTLARLREIKPGLNYLLPGQLPGETNVAHKIGYYQDWDGWVNNDAGIVTFPGNDGEEKAYAMTYLSQKASTEYLGYSFGAKLSRRVWAYFSAQYGTAAEPATGPARADRQPAPASVASAAQ